MAQMARMSKDLKDPPGLAPINGRAPKKGFKGFIRPIILGPIKGVAL